MQRVTVGIDPVLIQIIIQVTSKDIEKIVGGHVDPNDAKSECRMWPLKKNPIPKIPLRFIFDI
jgi:hypothetical protein